MPDTTTSPLAVVTGASSGIGYELARQFADAGYDLVLCAEDDGILAAGQAIAARTSSAVLVIRADLATAEGVEQLWEAVVGTGRPVAAAAIHAGAGVRGDFTQHHDLAGELRLVHLNVVSAVHLARLVLAQMTRAGTGRVLFTSSIAPAAPAPCASYAASKAFLLSFAGALQCELSDSGITVTALMPGPAGANFSGRAGMIGTKIGQMNGKDDPAEVARQGFAALMAGC